MHTKKSIFVDDQKILTRELNSKNWDKEIQIEINQFIGLITNKSLAELVLLLDNKKNELKTLNKSPNKEQHELLASLINTQLILSKYKLSLMNEIQGYLEERSIKHRERAETFQEAVKETIYMYQLSTLVILQKKILRGETPYEEPKHKYQQCLENKIADNFNWIIIKHHRILKQPPLNLLKDIPDELFPLIDCYYNSKNEQTNELMCDVSPTSNLYWATGGKHLIETGEVKFRRHQIENDKFHVVTLPPEVKGIKYLTRSWRGEKLQFAVIVTVDNQFFAALKKGNGISNFTRLDVVLNLDKDETIAGIQSSDTYMAVLVKSRNNCNAYLWNGKKDNAFVHPKKVGVSNVKDVLFHPPSNLPSTVAILSEDGNVYIYGGASFYRLEEPGKPIPIPEKIQSISVIDSYIMALSTEGNVYLIDVRGHYKPLNLDEKIHTIHSNGDFVGLVTLKGKVLVYFDGHSHAIPEFIPLELEGVNFSNKKIDFYSKYMFVVLKLTDNISGKTSFYASASYGHFVPWLPEIKMREFIPLEFPASVLPKNLDSKTPISKVGMWAKTEAQSHIPLSIDVGNESHLRK